jgi:hypothetical protein
MSVSQSASVSDKGLDLLRSYRGELRLNDEHCSVEFSVHVDSAGEVVIDFGVVPFTPETSLFRKWDREGPEFVEFQLSGRADDGTQFSTDDLHFTAVKTSWKKDEGSFLHPKPSCSAARFVRSRRQRARAPLRRMLLKGFRNHGPLQMDTPLGKIAMAGPTELPDANRVTGWIAVEANDTPPDIDQWLSEVDRLIEHVRRVMSFASGAVLRAPLREFYSGETVDVTAWSQAEQKGSALRVFHYLDQRAVFEAAVHSFLTPPIEVKSLFFAIEWFAMDAGYTEIRLINAMTALENLIDSNLDDAAALIQPPGQFEKTRRVLRSVIRACLSKWSSGSDAAEAALEVNEKLADLNRRSFLRKLLLLAERWRVPLDGISEDSLRAAKQARDRVVHRGQYYEDSKDGDADLWTHVTIVGEVVTRFLLTAIGYRGRYYSHVGGWHDAQFPPAPAEQPSE